MIKAQQQEAEEPPPKKPRTETNGVEPSHDNTEGDDTVRLQFDSKQTAGREDHPAKHAYQTGRPTDHD